MNETPPSVTPTENPSGFTRSKRLALYFSIGLIGAVLWPIQQNWRATPRDSFPLSYYPMFSNKREAIETFFYMVGRDTAGKRYYVPYGWIGSGGGNQVRRQLRKTINEGHAPELAQTVAKRVAKRETAPWSEVVSIAVCSGKFDVDAFYQGKKEAVSEKIQGFAQVERKAK